MQVPMTTDTEVFKIMCMSPEQKRQQEQARRESEEKTYNVCATGEKYSQTEYSASPNQINNE